MIDALTDRVAYGVADGLVGVVVRLTVWHRVYNIVLVGIADEVADGLVE
jgi:hypothetical protein